MTAIRKRASRPGEGRPSKYEPRFCEEVVEAARKGYSFGAFAGLIGVSHQTVKDWQAAHPEFLAASMCAKAARQVHWETAAIRVAERGGGPGTAQIIQFALKNVGEDDWKEKSEVRHSGDQNNPIIQRIERVIVDPQNRDA